MSKAADKDLPLKLQFQRILFAQGYWTPIEVDLSDYEGLGTTIKRRSLTDLDVLGIRFDDLFTRHCVVGDCKTGRRVSDANRLFWLRGVRDYFGADDAYYLRPKIDAHVAALAPKMGLRAVTASELLQIEQRTHADTFAIPVGNPTIHEQIQAKWGIDVPRGSSPTADQLRLKAVYSYLSYKYWYIQRFRNLMQLVGIFQSVADLLDPTDARHVLLAYSGAERFAHCLLEAASHIQSQGAGDVPYLARLYFYGGALAVREKQNFFDLLHKLTGVNEPLDPPWLANTVELLGRVISNPQGASDVLRHIAAIYLCCVHLGGPNVEGLTPGFQNIAAIVLAKDVAREFTKATGIRHILFNAMDSL